MPRLVRWKAAAAGTDSIGLRAVLFAGFVVLVAARIPGVLAGRFWAEDGFFFVDAVRLPWAEALFQQHTGYLDLVASFTMLLAARLVALENAPLVSLTVSLCVQVLPGLLLATGGIRAMRNPWCLGGALLILATVPLAEEVWLNPITGQYHLIVAAAIVLASAPGRGRTRWLHRAVLLVAPFSGPGPSLIAPLFFLRAMRDGCRERVVQAVLISAGTLVQVAMLLGHPVQERGLGLTPDLLLMVIAIKHVVVPLLWRSEAIAVANPLMDGWQADFVQRLAGAGYGWNRGDPVPVRHGGMALPRRGRTMAVSGRGSGDGAVLCRLARPEGRLAGHPVRRALLCRTADAVRADPDRDRRGASSRVGRLVAAGFAVWLIVIGAGWYVQPEPMMATGPDWRGEVAAWRADPGHALMLWPPWFTIALPASAATPGLGVATTP